jgi:hypothetical protein
VIDDDVAENLVEPRDAFLAIFQFVGALERLDDAVWRRSSASAALPTRETRKVLNALR